MDSIYLSRDACKDVLERLTVVFVWYGLCLCGSLPHSAHIPKWRVELQFQWCLLSPAWPPSSVPTEQGNSSTTYSCRTTKESPKDIRKCPAEPCLTARVNSRWGEGHGTQAAFITTNCSLFYRKWDPESLNIRLLESLGHKVSCGSLHRREELTAREAQTWSDSWISVMILILFWLTHDVWLGNKLSSLFHLPLWQPCFFLSSGRIQSD